MFTSLVGFFCLLYVIVQVHRQPGQPGQAAAVAGCGQRPLACTAGVSTASLPVGVGGGASRPSLLEGVLKPGGDTRGEGTVRSPTRCLGGSERPSDLPSVPSPPQDPWLSPRGALAEGAVWLFRSLPSCSQEESLVQLPRARLVV